MARSAAIVANMVSSILTANEVRGPQALDLSVHVKGRPRQNHNDGRIADDLRVRTAYLSATFTLEADDLIAAGMPEGVGMGMDPQKSLQAGDMVRREIHGSAR